MRVRMRMRARVVVRMVGLRVVHNKAEMEDVW